MTALAAGDQAALGRLYDRYGGRALGLALRIVGDRGLAEEIVQDAFVSVWRRAATYRPERGEPCSWLLSIVHHRAIDRMRGSGAAGRGDLDLSALTLAADGDVWAETARRLERAEIAAALAALPVEQREPIELAFFGGLTHVEIAASTRLPLGTVKGRVRLGLTRLRGHLQRRDESPSRAVRRAGGATVGSPSPRPAT
jgi:RNA polymerase sigma-70 factor (ECF subfamily)